MNKMQVRYNLENDELAQKIEDYIKDICNGVQATAEPISDGDLPWLAVGLVVAVTEAYWANRQDPDAVIFGIAVPEQNLLQVFMQDYKMDDPQKSLEMQAELHDTTDYIAVYIEV